MPAPRLISLKVYDADSHAFGVGNEIQADGDNDLYPHVERWQIDSSIDRATVLTITAFKGHAWHVEDLLQHRQRIVAEWDSGDKEIWHGNAARGGSLPGKADVPVWNARFHRLLAPR